MKYLILSKLFFICSILFISQSNAQTVQFSLTNSGSDLIIKIRPTGGNITGTFSSFNVNIRYPKSYGVSLGSVTNHITGLNVSDQTGQITDPNNSDNYYHEFAANGTGSSATYNDGIEYDVFTVPINQTGFGSGDFCLVDDGFVNYFETYAEFAGINRTNSTLFYGTGASATSVCVSATLGTAIAWIGTTSNWSLGSNWTGGSIPTQFQGASIPTSPAGGNFPSLSTSVSIKSLDIASSARVEVNGQTLTVTNQLIGSGLIRGSATSNIVLNGTAASTINMDQTTPGTSNLLNNLTVNNSGGLTIGDDLEIIGVLTPTAGTIASGGNLIIAATGKTVYGQIAGTGSGTITGNVVMEKFLNNTNQGWRHLSIPLAGTLSGFGSIDLQYTSPQNVMFWDATDAGGGTAAGWANGTSGSSRSIGGFTIYSDNAIGFDITQTINYTGTYDKSDLGFAIKSTEDPNGSGATATGWNLIGNPFPSNLDLTAMFADWANNGNLTYEGIHIWDAVNEQYVAIMGNGASVNYNTDGGDDVSTEILAPFQAFWVKANADVTFTVENGYRTTSNTNRGTFLKKDFDLARLKVLDPNGKLDQTVIYFHESASNSFDGAYDGYKLISMSADVPSLYSVSPEGIFSINGLNSDNFSHTVPLGFRSNQTGEMTFSLNIDQLDAKWFVYLEDKELGIFYNIKDKPYTFNHTQNGDDRFVLHFQTYGLSTEKLVDDVQKMKIGGDGNAIYVFVPAYHKDQNYQLEIIDMAGRVVYTDMKLSLHHGMNTMNLNLNSTAYYAVRIKAAEGIASGKIQLR